MLLMMMLKKYRAWFKIGLVNAFYHRGEMAVWSVIHVLPLVAMLVIWPIIYQTTDTIQSYNLAEIITYYVAGNFISGLVQNQFDTWLAGTVRRGDIAKDIIQPIPLQVKTLVGESSWKLLRQMVFSLPLLAIILLISRQPFIWPTPIGALQLAVMIIIGFVISGLFNLFVVGTAFVFEQAQSLTHLRWALVTILGGSLIPLTFFPGPVQTIANLLPFKFVYAVPTNIWLGKTTVNQFSIDVALGIGWILILSIIMKRYWNKTIKSFTAVGN